MRQTDTTNTDVTALQNSLQMGDRDIAPVVAQILCDEPAMAMFRGRFTAQQHGGRGEQAARNLRFNPPLAHQGKKTPLVNLPARFFLSVFVEHLVCRRQQRLVLVRRVADHTQKVREVIALGKASELRRIVQADVYEPSYPHSSEGFEELLCGLLCETGRIDFHSFSSDAVSAGSSHNESC